MDSDSENPFVLTPRHGGNSPKRVRYGNVWSESEQNEKLHGYLEIASEFWPSLKAGSHIRYITTNNEFRTGGFIVKNACVFKSTDNLIKPSVKIDLGTEKIGFRLQNFFNRKSTEYLTWTVAYEDIMKLYLKIDAGVRMVVQSLEVTIESININMKKMTEYIKRMDERIKKLESK